VVHRQPQPTRGIAAGESPCDAQIRRSAEHHCKITQIYEGTNQIQRMGMTGEPMVEADVDALV
jgi:hypothetical protein